LGAGTALPSLISHSCGYRVCITDIKKNIPLIKEILQENNIEINQNCFVEPLHWDNVDDINSIKKKTSLDTFDIIMGSEILYLDEYFDDLINVIKTFSHSHTLTFIAFKIRIKEMADQFFEKLSQYFDYFYVENEEVLKVYPRADRLKVIIAKLK
jgi:hypothetical protein